jgi:small subunit ribosomal protein S7
MRKFTASDQQLKPDPRYNSKLVSKFVNCMMWGGKKSVAQRVFYDAMDIITGKIDELRLPTGDLKSKIEARKSEITPLEVFEMAVNNVKPLLEVRSKRVGGASYQVPMQVNSKRQQSLAFRWILASARSKKGKPMCERLASELMDAYNKHGGAMTTRENVHRMAEANKAFAHFAW